MGKEDIRALIEELRSGEDVCDEDLKTAQGWEDADLAGDDFTAFLGEEKERTAAVLKEVGLIQ